MYLVFGKDNCPYCEKAKKEMNYWGDDYIYINLSSDDRDATAYKALLKDKVGMKTVPVIMEVIGGYDDLEAKLIAK